jgi:hypothetical protein
MIKVEPLPEGTTDIDIMEAGWDYVDESKIVVYGAVDPVPTILEKLNALSETLLEAEESAFKNRSSANAMINKLEAVQKQVAKGAYAEALEKLQNDLLKKADGCVVNDDVDKNDWVIDCDIQKQIYWALNEIIVLLKIMV